MKNLMDARFPYDWGLAVSLAALAVSGGLLVWTLWLAISDYSSGRIWPVMTTCAVAGVAMVVSSRFFWGVVRREFSSLTNRPRDFWEMTFSTSPELIGQFLNTPVNEETRSRVLSLQATARTTLIAALAALPIAGLVATRAPAPHPLPLVLILGGAVVSWFLCLQSWRSMMQVGLLFREGSASRG